MKIKITETHEELIEGTWSAQSGADEQAVIDAVEAYLNERGYDFDRKDISCFKSNGCAMIDDCQSDGEWMAEIWR